MEGQFALIPLVPTGLNINGKELDVGGLVHLKNGDRIGIFHRQFQFLTADGAAKRSRSRSKATVAKSMTSVAGAGVPEDKENARANAVKVASEQPTPAVEKPVAAVTAATVAASSTTSTIPAAVPSTPTKNQRKKRKLLANIGPSQTPQPAKRTKSASSRRVSSGNGDKNAPVPRKEELTLPATPVSQKTTKKAEAPSTPLTCVADVVQFEESAFPTTPEAEKNAPFVRDASKPWSETPQPARVTKSQRDRKVKTFTSAAGDVQMNRHAISAMSGAPRRRKMAVAAAAMAAKMKKKAVSKRESRPSTPIVKEDNVTEKAVLTPQPRMRKAVISHTPGQPARTKFRGQNIVTSAGVVPIRHGNIFQSNNMQPKKSKKEVDEEAAKEPLDVEMGESPSSVEEKEEIVEVAMTVQESPCTPITARSTVLRNLHAVSATPQPAAGRKARRQRTITDKNAGDLSHRHHAMYNFIEQEKKAKELVVEVKQAEVAKKSVTIVAPATPPSQTTSHTRRPVISLTPHAKVTASKIARARKNRGCVMTLAAGDTPFHRHALSVGVPKKKKRTLSKGEVMQRAARIAKGEMLKQIQSKFVADDAIKVAVMAIETDSSETECTTTATNTTTTATTSIDTDLNVNVTPQKAGETTRRRPGMSFSDHFHHSNFLISQ